ncbi:MAG: hypothetical protein U0N20_09815, partial [Clostridium sp.]
YGETAKKEEFLNIIKESMERIVKADISVELLEQLKHRYFGQAIRSLNSFDDIAISYIRSYFDRADFFKLLDILYEITLEDIKRVCSSIRLDHSCLVELVPNKKI